jgi:hypothetical protein
METHFPCPVPLASADVGLSGELREACCLTEEIPRRTILGIDAAMQHPTQMQKTLNQEHVKKETFQLIAPDAEEVLSCSVIRTTASGRSVFR